MPHSKAEYYLARAVLSGKASNSKMSEAAAQEIVNATGPGDLKNLPYHVKRKKKSLTEYGK